MTRQARTDLRDRMQRVAAKPATHPDTTARTRSAPKRTTTAARRGAAVPVEADPAPRSRLEAFAGWAEWELMTVPQERFRWMKAVLFGEGGSDDGDGEG